ncbi:MAG TPA: hypothetical protein VGN72_03325 [Tepidisphaeraceae bacterium]|nr:hypothetical protein [Tepidisphaeraceae bacterium]
MSISTPSRSGEAGQGATRVETRWGVTRISGDEELRTPCGATIVSWWWFLVPAAVGA